MTDDTASAAPENKAMPDPMTAAFDDDIGAFEAFKEANDRRLEEIESKMTADVVTRAKVDRINRAVDEQNHVLDQMALKRARGAYAGGQQTQESEEGRSLYPPSHHRKHGRR